MSSKLTLEERIELHRRMALSYYSAYDKKAVKDGATYDEWKFADDAVYFSPYFGKGIIELKNHPISVKTSATMEAKAYSLRFPDWGIQLLAFRYRLRHENSLCRTYKRRKRNGLLCIRLC